MFRPYKASPRVRQLAVGLALFGAGAASTLVAQTMTDSAHRVEQKRADLTGAPGMEVIESLHEYRPGDAIGLHHHHGVEAVYVIQGAMIQMPGKDPTPMPTGTVSMNLRDVNHAGYTVVGDTPLKLFTVHIVDKGKPLYDYVQ